VDATPAQGLWACLFFLLPFVLAASLLVRVLQASARPVQLPSVWVPFPSPPGPSFWFSNSLSPLPPVPLCGSSAFPPSFPLAGTVNEEPRAH